MEWQAGLAKEHDVDAFVFYHYWFDGKRLLEGPVDKFLGSDIGMPFALCWANENWTRRWDGKEREILIAQNYDADSPDGVFESLLPYLKDSRYVRRAGALVLLVHRADHLPEPRAFAARWRERARAEGLGELWLVASETHSVSPLEIGFDAVAEFPPVGDSDLTTSLRRLPAGTEPGFRGRMCSYEALADKYMSRRAEQYPTHRTVVPRWDNTPRRLHHATMFLGSTPEYYRRWLAAARESERQQRGSEGIVFINAWNEWAEGAYLEPDSRWGHAYLEMTRWGAEPDASQVLAPEGEGRMNVPGLALGAARSAKSVAQTLLRRDRR
jgi:lipopolysaccharide biosynthesis protein